MFEWLAYLYVVFSFFVVGVAIIILAGSCAVVEKLLEAVAEVFLFFFGRSDNAKG